MDFSSVFSLQTVFPSVALSNLISSWILHLWSNQHTVGWLHQGRTLFTRSDWRESQSCGSTIWVGDITIWNQYTDSNCVKGYNLYTFQIKTKYRHGQKSFKDDYFTLPYRMLYWCGSVSEAYNLITGLVGNIHLLESWYNVQLMKHQPTELTSNLCCQELWHNNVM